MKSHKITYIVLLCVLVSSLFVMTISVLAQGDTRITALSPDSIEEKVETQILIEGTGLDYVKTVVLIPFNNRPITLTHLTQSTQKILVSVPSTLEAGQYDLCVKTNSRELCRTLEIVQALQTEIVSVIPDAIYLTDFTPSALITITLASFDPQSTAADYDVMLGNQALVTQNFDRNTGIINATISNLPAGNYSLRITKLGHASLVYESITILGNLNPVINSVEPNQVLQGTDGVTVTLKGQNLDLVESITGVGEDDCFPTSSVGCKFISASDNEIILKLTHNSTQKAFTQDWQLGFPDGSSVSVPPTNIIPRVAPNNFLTWVIYVIAILISGFYLLMMVDYGSTQNSTTTMFSFDKHDRNKTAPDFSELAGNLLVGLFIMAMLLVLTALVSFCGSLYGYGLGWQFQVITLLTHYNVATFFIIAFLAGRFYPVGSSVIRYTSATIFSSVAIILPFLLQSRLQTSPTIWWEIGLFAIGFTSGQIVLRYANFKLKQNTEDGPRDDVLKVQIRQRLYQFGEVVAENDFVEIPQNRITNLMAQYVAEHEDEQSLYFSESDGRLRFTQYELISNLSNHFRTVEVLLDAGKNISYWELSNAITELYHQIQSALGLVNGKPYPSTKLPAQFFLHSTFSPELESVLPNPFPTIIFAAKQSIRKGQLSELKNLLNTMQLKLRFAIIIVISETEETRRMIRNAIVENLTGQNIVIFGKEDFQEILGSRLMTRQALMNAIQKQVDFKILSPYRTEAPAPRDMFYGRREEIKKILETIEDGSVIVLGARRIGKTSILQIAQQELMERQKVFLYLDCYPVNNHESFFTNLVTAWSFIDLDFTQYQKPSDFRQLVNDLQQVYPNRQIVFQFDEVDQLLVYDNQYHQNKNIREKDKQKEPLFRMMRTLSQEKKCQFIFSGERRIMQYLNDPQSAFFNFPKPIRLGVLGQQITYDLVQKPMELVGIELQADDINKILDAVHLYTAGHPNLIQVLCDNILKNLSARNTRILTYGIVAEEASRSAFGDRFRKTFWSQATPVEKAISAAVAELNEPTAKEILEHLMKYGFEPGIQELEEGINYLELSQLLTVRGNRYCLLSEQFATFMSIYPYTYWYKQWLQDYEDNLFRKG